MLNTLETWDVFHINWLYRRISSINNYLAISFVVPACAGVCLFIWKLRLQVLFPKRNFSGNFSGAALFANFRSYILCTVYGVHHKDLVTWENQA